MYMHGLETEEAKVHSPDELLPCGPPEHQKKQTVGRHLRLYLLMATAVVLAIVIGGMIVSARRRAKSEGSSGRAQQQRPVNGPSDQIVASATQLRQISVEPVSEATVTADRETTGKVSFNEDRLTPVFTPYAGRALEVNASKGDSVRSGTTLMVIESADLVAAQNDLSAARADQTRARIARQSAEVASQRANRLHEHEAVATKDVQLAEQDLARASADENRADAAVTVAINRLALFGKSPEEIAHLGTGTGGPSAPYVIDRRVTIKAPISGTIVDRKIGPGQYIKPDAPDPLFLISDLSTVWVVADVFESDLLQLRNRAPVEIHIDAYPARTFPAQVSFISPSVDPATHTVRVRCLVHNADGALKPDMFARIRIHSAAEERVAVVPAAAVISEGDRSVVFLEQEPGRFCRREIHIDRQVNGLLVVRNGLRSGDRIVTRGALLLNEVSKPEG